MNKKLNVLVTAVGGDVGQSVKKCLENCKYELNITGCDSNPYSPREGLNKFLVAPPIRDLNEFQEFIISVVKQFDIDFIFPVYEPEIRIYTDNSIVFQDIRSKLIINDKEIINLFSDKYFTAEWLKKNNFSYPESYLKTEFREQLDYPFLIKPREGSGSRGVLIINNREDFKYHTKNGDDLLIQEYLEGEDNEFTAAIFCDGSGEVFDICFKRKLSQGGYSSQIELVNDPRIHDLLIEIGGKIGVRGFVNIQFRIVGDKIVIFEMNPRFSSTVFFRHVFGFRDVEWSIALALGHDFHYENKYSRGFGIRKLSEEFFDLG